MNRRFNMYSRSDEDKTRDMIMYETKAKAAELCQKFDKTKSRAGLVSFISLIVFAVCAFPLFYKAYDNESIIGMIICILAVAILTVVARITAGAVMARSLKVYLTFGRLCTKWSDARKDMHDYEAKFADQTVFEPDLKKAEKRLMAVCEEVISFAESHGMRGEE